MKQLKPDLNTFGYKYEMTSKMQQVQEMFISYLDIRILNSKKYFFFTQAGGDTFCQIKN